MKGTLVFRFGPNLKLKFWPKPKLNNINGYNSSVEKNFETFTSILILNITNGLRFT